MNLNLRNKYLANSNRPLRHHTANLYNLQNLYHKPNKTYKFEHTNPLDTGDGPSVGEVSLTADFEGGVDQQSMGLNTLSNLEYTT